MSEVAPVEMSGNVSFILKGSARHTFSKKQIAVVILSFQAVLLYGDFLSGPWVPFGIFYLITLYFTVKHLGGTLAYINALVIVGFKTYISVLTFPIDAPLWQILWKFISSYSIYAVFCYLISSQLNARRHAENIAVQASLRAGEAERNLLKIGEETQHRIGRELHDDLGQHLTGLAFMAQVLSQKLRDAGWEEVKDADRITLMLNQAISKSRNISHGLYPPELEEHGLRGMLEKFVDYIEMMYPVSCDFLCGDDCHMEDHDIAVHLFRIAQEAVNNAIRHGQATYIVLRMSRDSKIQMLEILDNGCGVAVNVAKSVVGLGMRSMNYRADLIGASLNVSSRDEGGTQVVVRMSVCGNSGK